ncbi:MAG: hypothetical protein J6L88_06275 [Clostridia bacterium]|nr:hypothetical protein [Clostridia bacterium]
MALIGIDVGGTGVKAVAFSTTGEILASTYQEYDMYSDAPGHFEAVPSKIYQSTRKVLRATAAACPERVDGIGVSSFAESFVCFDKDGNILCNSLMYLDTRGTDLPAKLFEKFPLEEVKAYSGASPRHIHSIFRMMLMNEIWPGVLEKTAKIHFMADFIVSCLGGEHYTDYSLATSSLAFDINKKQWRRDIFEWVGLNPDALPKPLPTGAKIGELSAAAALDLGLPAGIPLVSGGHDHIASSVGAGVYKAGQMMNAIGTVDGFTILTDSAEVGRAANGYDFIYKPHYFQENYAVMTSNLTGGVLLKWFRDHIGKFEKEFWANEGKDFYAEFEKQMAKEPTDLIVLPRFGGAKEAPFGKKAGILNMTLSTTNEEIYRAFMEGESFEMFGYFNNFLKSGGRVDSLTAVGGGARCDTYMQIRSDIFNVPVRTVTCDQPGALGDAMMAGIAAGVFANADEAISSIVGIRRVFEPDAKRHEYYMEQYDKYCRIYEFLATVK